jgi:hypothetical protein
LRFGREVVFVRREIGEHHYTVGPEEAGTYIGATMRDARLVAISCRPPPDVDPQDDWWYVYPDDDRRSGTGLPYLSDGRTRSTVSQADVVEARVEACIKMGFDELVIDYL